MNSGTLQSSPTNLLTLATGLTQIPAGKTISNTTAFDPNYKIPYSQSWNLQVQRTCRASWFSKSTTSV